MLSFLRRWFRSDADCDGEPESVEQVEYAGFVIIPTPRKTAGGWSTEGDIRKITNGETRATRFIRADTSTSREAAVVLSVGKARKIIDEQGDRVFGILPARATGNPGVTSETAD